MQSFFDFGITCSVAKSPASRPVPCHCPAQPLTCGYFSAMPMHLFGRLFAHLPTLVLLVLVACGDRKQSDAAQFFQRGREQFRKQQYEDAIRLFGEATKVDSTFAEAWNNRGVAKAKLGRHDAALADYDRALRADSTLADAHFNRSMAYYELQRYAEALADLAPIAARRRDSVDFFLHRGTLLNQLAQPDQALADFDRAIALAPQTAEPYINRGTIHFGQKRVAEAEKDFRQALALAPDHAFALNNLGLVLAQQGKLAEALPLFDRAVGIEGKSAYYLNNRAFVKLGLGDLAGAGEDLKLSLYYDDQNPLALRNQGIWALRSGQAGPALEWLRKAQALNPRTDDLHYYLGLAHLANQQPAEACREWQQSLASQERKNIPEMAQHCR
jgi:tetratricopeptide (TPR) repeat protein